MCSTARYTMLSVLYLPRNSKNEDQWGSPLHDRISITGDPWTRSVWTTWVPLPVIFFFNKSSQPSYPWFWFCICKFNQPQIGKLFLHSEQPFPKHGVQDIGRKQFFLQISCKCRWRQAVVKLGGNKMYMPTFLRSIYGFLKCQLLMYTLNKFITLYKTPSKIQVVKIP